MKRIVLLAGIMLGFCWAGRAVASTVQSITPSNMDGWAFQVTSPDGTGAMVTGPATPPLGTGSAHLSTGTNGDDSAQIRSSDYNGVALSSLTALSYSEYMTSPSNGQQVPYLILNIDNDNNGSVDDFLFFEPSYQTPGTGNPSLPNQGATTFNTWQTWDALDGGWWSVNGTAGANPGTGVKSLADYIAAEPNSVIRNSPLGGVRLVVGFASSTDVLDGYVDNVTIGDAVTTFNFDPDAPVAVPVPASAWGGLVLIGLLATVRVRRRMQSV